MKKINDKNTVWYEKYKPMLVDDLILPQDLRDKLQKMVREKDLPNLGLFSSVPGTGKSCTCNAILTELGCESIWINGSLENGIDTLRGKIAKFASQSSFDGELKYVVIDEADYLNSNSTQPAFRGFMDEFSSNVRFIFTGNYKEKIIEPLLTRLQIIDYELFKKEDMVKEIFGRLKFILENENISFDPKSLVPVINTYYPSIRSMIGTIQKFSNNGEFKISEAELDDTNVFSKIVSLMSPSTFTEMIAEVNKLNAPEGMFSFLYKNYAELFKQDQIPGAIVTIAKYQHMSSSVRDKNLNLGAALTELLRFKK